jgi:hypothetical protein
MSRPGQFERNFSRNSINTTIMWNKVFKALETTEYADILYALNGSIPEWQHVPEMLKYFTWHELVWSEASHSFNSY